MYEESLQIPLNSVGLVKEELTVQPTLLNLAIDSLIHMSEYILPALLPTINISKLNSDDDLLADRDNVNINNDVPIDVKKDLQNHEKKRSKILKSKKNGSVNINTSTKQATARNTNHSDRNIDIDATDISSTSKLLKNDSVSTDSMKLKVNTSTDHEDNVREETPLLSVGGSKLPSKIRVLGHSAGGAVGAYIAMMLEGMVEW